MRKSLPRAPAIAGLLGLSLAAVPGAAQRDAPAPNVLRYTMKDLDGRDVPLRRFRGRVLLLVNVASRCGNTPQYAGLQQLYETYRERGFDVLGFPADDFGMQEPGSNAEIKAFCSTQFGVSFPMFAKIVVRGEGQAPLYRDLTDRNRHPETGGEVEWNFAKFLVDRNGRVVARFPARQDPESPELVAALEGALADR